MEFFSGPQFLAVYGVLCVAVVALGAWFVRSKDTSLDAGPEPVSNDLDPYEIAYLRGGERELVRYLVFELTRDGWVEVAPATKKREPARIARTAAMPSGSLSEFAKIVYDYFATPHTATELFASKVPKTIEEAYGPQREKLAARHLLGDEDAKSASGTVRYVGSVIVGGLLLARLWYAIVMHHRNVVFMIAIGVAALLALFALTGAPRVSKRGRRYLESLRASLPASSEPAAVASPAFGLVVAAAGVGALAGTPYAALGDTFKQQLASGNWSSSCSSSGSSCGGGGCGGGSGCGG
jgi:uncharacterized protein (TIGR04222 family)